MSEHEGEKHEEKSNPVMTGMEASHYAHAVTEGVVNPELYGKPIGELFQFGEAAEEAEEVTKVFNGTASAAETGMYASNAIMGPLAIAGGIYEMIEGGKEVHEGKTADGAISIGAGGLTTASGVSSMIALGGSTAAQALAPVALAGATGLKVGRFGDHQVKERGWLHDDEGSALSASEWAGRKGQAADDWVTKHLCGPAGTVAGIATTLGATIPASVMAVGGAAASVGDRINQHEGVMSQMLRMQGVGSKPVGESVLAGAHQAQHDDWRVE